MRHMRILGFLLAASVTAAQAGFGETPAGPTARPLGQIHVSVEPDGASLTCDGKPVDASPVTIDSLEEGDHLIVATKLGYGEERRTVTLAPGQRANLEIKLSRIFGLVLIQSEPAGADVEVNGAFRGKTPVLLTDLPLGSARVRLTTPGYMAREIDLNIEKRTPQKVFVELASNSARLTLNSEPVGARVIVNGVYRGTTPCIVDRIPEGESTIEMTVDGYRPHKQQVKLVAGEQQTVAAVLKSIPAKLSVTSIPAGARIYINNQFRGTAPVSLDNLESGVYRLRAEVEGHEVMARTVELSRGQDLVEEFRLQGNTGMLEIMTEPAEVTIIIDGTESGATVAKPGETDRVSEPLRIDQLSEGRHEVQLTKKGYFGERVQIVIERAKTVSLHKQLRKRFIPDCEVVTKSAVHRGVLLEVSPNGDLKLEVNPGVTRTIPADEIRFRRPLRAPDE